MATSSVSNPFPVKQRKALGKHLSSLSETQLSDISERALNKVKKRLHVNYYSERLRALNDPSGEQHLLKCAKAMCCNFSSYYYTFLPRKRYVPFQHAWFMHIRQYIDGTRGQGVPSSDVVSRTRSGRRMKDHGAQMRVEAVDCKLLWDNFVQSLSSQISINDQRIIVSSLAYAIYDLMTDEVKSFKSELAAPDVTTEDKDDHQKLEEFKPRFETEDVIHRYLGFAVMSLMNHKKRQLKQTTSAAMLSQHSSKGKIRQELSLLRHMIANEESEDIPSEVLQLSQGGLTQVSPKMLKYGGDLLMEFSKLCGSQFTSEVPHLSKTIINSDKLKNTFLECLKNIKSDIEFSEDVSNSIFIEITTKILNARVNEMMKAQQEIDLEKEGKVVDTSQSLRDTLKAYSISKQRLN